MTVIVLVQESAINTRGHLQTQPSCPEGVGAAPLCWMPGLGQLGYELLGGLGGAQPAGGGWGEWGRILPGCTPGWGCSQVPGCCREDKRNILRGCNVNRAGAEPLFMESLSCQGICQGPDLRSYLDKGAGEGERSWRQSHSTVRAAARRELIRGCPGVGG